MVETKRSDPSIEGVSMKDFARKLSFSSAMSDVPANGSILSADAEGWQGSVSCAPMRLMLANTSGRKK